MEESFHIAQLGWLGFFFILLVLGAGIVFYFLVLRRILQNYRHLTTRGIHVLFIDRLVILGFLFTLSLSFFSVNPFVHGIIIGFGMVFLYPLIRQVIRGVIVISSTRISKGNGVELGSIKGVVSYIGWTALIINSDGKSHVLPYSKIHSEGLSISDSSVSSRLYNVTCKPKDERKKMTEVISDVKELLFTFPFISSQVTPQVVQEDERIKIVFALSSDLYLNGLIQKLNSAGLETHIQK